MSWRRDVLAPPSSEAASTPLSTWYLDPLKRHCPSSVALLHVRVVSKKALTCEHQSRKMHFPSSRRQSSVMLLSVVSLDDMPPYSVTSLIACISSEILPLQASHTCSHPSNGGEVVMLIAVNLFRNLYLGQASQVVSDHYKSRA
jgi:hypothetical protein